YGDYVASGMPAEVFREFIGETSSNPLGREGESADIPYVFNAFEAPNGVPVIGGVNCFGCHTSWIDGEFVVGLGDSFSDTTTSQASQYAVLGALIDSRYDSDSPEADAYRHLGLGAAAAAEPMVAPFQGVNTAFALEAAVVAHRDPETLLWEDAPRFDLAPTIASDVPPWWNVGKKHALYYNGMGRGDFARLMMQICVVGVWDAEHAADIDAHFPDVLAWLSTLQPPPWPGDIDAGLADDGAGLFGERCARCHGTYSDDPDVETYPNLLVSIEEVGTDPALADSYLDQPAFIEWLQASWFANHDSSAVFVGDRGYIAPPLDGIWATAPYLHNGSVPDLYALLDSDSRPERWRRDFGDSTYDLDRVGWPHEVVESASDTDVYDTTRRGYTSQGHTYGDDLTDAERDALVEYLKGL
ncbi:MAG: mono/diheme cytochrome c family protein, partial [Myxococcota bacterium]